MILGMFTDECVHSFIYQASVRVSENSIITIIIIKAPAQ